ncbi:MAG TPA: hypothetical protein VNS31_00680 [Ramlibacter sp.]|nr:hypothetical protein [Ramlibacter sp.]
MTKILVSAVIIAASGLALAKLPPMDDAAKAKAAETAAKAAWQGKVDAYQLCKVQDKIAARYKASSGSKPAAEPKPTAVPVAQSPAGAASGGTPAVAKPPPPCAEPGPFAYNAPEQKPLETSGAHSPAGNATSPPSVRPESATMVPAKK